MSLTPITVSNRARADLLHLAGTIAADSPESARRLVDRFEEQLSKVARFPESMALLDFPQTAGMGLRRGLIRGFPNHLFIYAFDGERVEVLRLFHAAQDWVADLMLDT